MNRNEILRLVLPFALGVLLTLLLTRWFTPGRYVPFGPGTNQILDTRNGRVFGQTQSRDGRGHVWIVLVREAGMK